MTNACCICLSENMELVPDEGDDWWCAECIREWERENNQRWEDGGQLENARKTSKK